MKQPEWHQYDKSSKWLIQHYGDSILRLAGIEGIVSWQPLQAEVVQPHQLPDGLLEVRLAGQAETDLFILELATYPERRLAEQILRDLTLVYLDRRDLPEVLALVLHPKGNYKASDSLEFESRRGLTRWQVRFRVVELWTLPAESLLAADDVGLIPWVPLTKFAESPESVFRQCRERIDQQASSDKHESLLAVSQVRASLRYNDPQLLAIFGGKEAMLEFPAIQDLLAETRAETAHKLILRFLETRFGALPPDLLAELRKIVDEEKLSYLAEQAALCPDLKSFWTQMQ